ncbi:MAG: crossover junction endodeoxyribonuclease RuvC [Gammaproteobacteria bacterium HGW-Gammaproteobacteria-2]|nr:MAG: crossover junction endodeoxyribonuclease RuvC [Gammaproteobacteria bacterium HGW-Gammaproteobacteria-2]
MEFPVLKSPTPSPGRAPHPSPESPVPSPGSVRILGIDPGSVRTGVGIVDADSTGHCVHVHNEALHVGGAEDFPQRLKAILFRLWALIDTYQPNEVAIERVFVAKNPDSALKLGQARGAAICAVVARDLPVLEYSPMQIKSAVVGRGAADKGQVQHMVGVLLNLHEKLQADAADALAVAITHAHTRTLAERTGTVGSQLLRRRGRSRR